MLFLYRRDANIRLIKDRNKSLEQKLAQTIEERNTTVSDLERQLEDAKREIAILKDSLSKEKQEANAFREETKVEVQKCQSIEHDRAAKDLAANEELTQKVNVLTNLSASYIQGLYDQCLEQEQILLLEGALPSVHGTKKNTKSDIESLRHIEEKLKQKKDSIHINWEMMLKDESVRRIIFGNLNNRTQMNLGHIDKLIQKLHAKYGNEMRRVNKTNEQRLNGVCTSYDDKISLLQTQATRTDTELDLVSTDCLETKKHLATALSDIERMKVDKTNCDETIVGLDQALSETKQSNASLNNELSKVRLE